MAMSCLTVLRLDVKEIISFFSFGSIIVGAIRTKFAAKGGKSRDTKSSPGTKKGSRGSFSFKGGMQVIICNESQLCFLII